MLSESGARISRTAKYPVYMTPDPPSRAREDGDRLAIPLDPVAALKALLAVDPDAPPVGADGKPQPEPAEREREAD